MTLICAKAYSMCDADFEPNSVDVSLMKWWCEIIVRWSGIVFVFACAVDGFKVAGWEVEFHVFAVH